MNWKKWAIIVIVILITCCVLFFWIDQKVNEVQDQHRKFIYCSLINQGMTREEVYSQLSVIGEFEESFREDPEYLDLSRIHFVDKKTCFITGGDTIIAYEDGKVLLRYYYHSVSDRYYFCDEEKEALYGSQ